MNLDGGDEVSIVPFVYPRGTVSVSSMVYFCLLVLLLNLLILPCLSLGARHIQEYFNNKRGRKRKFINPQKEEARNEKRMKRGKVIVRENLVVGHWELIPMESGDEFSAPQDIATVRVAEERQESRKQRNHWWAEAN